MVAQPSGNSGCALAIYLCEAVLTTGTPFTVTVAGTNFIRSAIAIEYDTPLALDQVASGGGNSNTASAGPTAALAANEAVLVAVAVTLGSTIWTASGGGWTQELEDLVASPTGEVDTRLTSVGLRPTISWALNGAHFWGAALAAFIEGALPLLTVPDVVGMTEAAADAALVAAGFVTGTVTTAPSDTIAAGLVISQSPGAGASATIGAAVDYVISTGPEGPPVYVISIGEVEVVPLLATFRIQETIDAPDTMIADVFSVGSPFLRPPIGESVFVTENGVRIFGGLVTGTRERGLTGPSATDLVVEIQATSYELSASRRVITAALSQGTPPDTIAAVFATLVTDYYGAVGVSLHPDQVAGPGVPAATFERMRGDAVNKQLAASVGYLQSIDFENRLRAWAPGDILAPDDYDEAVNPDLLTGDITVERQLQNGYANRVILVGTPIPVPDHKDTFTGDGVTATWPITYKVTGRTRMASIRRWRSGWWSIRPRARPNRSAGWRRRSGFLWEYDPIALTIHRRGGPVAAGVAFEFRYHGLFLPAGMAEDTGEIATYGLWEHVENVTAVITTASAQEYADALLAAKIASKDEIVTLQTYALGFHPGQTMTIASSSRLLSGDYLITQVDTAADGSTRLRRSLTASKSQNNTHDWRRIYQQWAGVSAASESA